MNTKRNHKLIGIVLLLLGIAVLLFVSIKPRKVPVERYDPNYHSITPQDISEYLENSPDEIDKNNYYWRNIKFLGTEGYMHAHTYSIASTENKPVLFSFTFIADTRDPMAVYENLKEELKAKLGNPDKMSDTNENIYAGWYLNKYQRINLAVTKDEDSSELITLIRFEDVFYEYSTADGFHEYNQLYPNGKSTTSAE